MDDRELALTTLFDREVAEALDVLAWLAVHAPELLRPHRAVLDAVLVSLREPVRGPGDPEAGA